MKKLLLSALFIMAVSVAYAQYRDVRLPEKPVDKGYNDYDKESTPFWFAVEGEVGSSIMNKGDNMQYTSATVTAGYRISEFLRLGAGLGAKLYVNNAEVRDTDNKFGVPLFVNARGNFVSAYDRDGVPFWSVNLGTVTYEGLYLSPTIGYSFGGLRNTFNVGISYTLSTFKDYNKKDQAYSYFGVKVGYEF